MELITIDQNNLTSIQQRQQQTIELLEKRVLELAYKPISKLTDVELEVYHAQLKEVRDKANKAVNDLLEQRKNATRPLDEFKKLFTQQEKTMALEIAKMDRKLTEIAEHVGKKLEEKRKKELEEQKQKEQELAKLRNDETFVNAKIIERCEGAKNWFNEPERTVTEIRQFLDLTIGNAPFEASDELMKKYIDEVNSFLSELKSLAPQRIKDIEQGVNNAVDLTVTVSNDITEAHQMAVISENIAKAEVYTPEPNIRKNEVYNPSSTMEWRLIMQWYITEMFHKLTPSECEKKFKFALVAANNHLKQTGEQIEGITMKEIFKM